MSRINDTNEILFDLLFIDISIIESDLPLSSPLESVPIRRIFLTDGEV